MADTRIHGTTRQQVGKAFEEIERSKLLPLPASLFPVFEEAPRTVHRDGYIELRRSYYSVPPEHVGRQVWARLESRLVRVFNQRREVIAIHALAEAGKFATDPNHLHSPHRHVILDYLLEQAGPASQLDFLETHPLIRSLDDYQHCVPDCFAASTHNDPPHHEPA